MIPTGRDAKMTSKSNEAARAKSGIIVPPRTAGRFSNPGRPRFSEADCGRSRLGRKTILRAEVGDGQTSLTAANDLAIRRALEAAGVEFIDGDGGGPGVRPRKRLG